MTDARTRDTEAAMQTKRPKAVQPLNPADLDLTDLRWLAMLAEDAEYRRRHAPSRRRLALLARWEAWRERGDIPSSPTTPASWTPAQARQWLTTVAASDARAWLARVAGVNVEQLEAALWWFALSDRQRFDLELVSYRALRDEHEQEQRHRQRELRKHLAETRSA